MSSGRQDTAQSVQSPPEYILYCYLSGVFCWIFLSILRFFSSIKWFRDDSHPLHPLTAHKHTFTLFHRREESPWAKPHTHTPAPRSCSPGRSAKALRVCMYYYSKVFNLAFFLSLSTISVFLSHTHAVNHPQLCHMSYEIQYSCVPLGHTPETGLESPKCLTWKAWYMCVRVHMLQRPP